MRNFSKAILVASAALCLNLSAFSQNVSFSVQNVTVKEAMEQLKKTSGYSFVFSSSDVDTSKKVSVSGQNSSIQDIIQQILQGQNGLDYEIQGKKIIVKKIGTSNSLKNQKRILASGKVLDVNGEPIIGATVLEKGTSNGTITDFEGNFSLNVPINITLEISYVGYQNQQITVQTERPFNIVLKEDSETLDEIVVVGYGVQKKSDVTGAVGSVNSDNILSKGSTSVMESLQGQVAGVDISQSSSRAGEGFSISIRGKSSMAGGNPLYVIDGVVCDNMDFLNPADIEKIDILKDASSTAIYGSRATNGVVMITTKQAGTADKDNARVQVSYDGYYGFKTVANMPEFMDGDEWTNYRFQRYTTLKSVDEFGHPTYEMLDSEWRAFWGNNSPKMKEMFLSKDYYDWPDLVTSDGHQQNHYINIAGNAKKISYRVGLGYQNEDGVLGDSYERWNLKAAVDNKINDHFSIGALVNLSTSMKDYGSKNSVLNGFRANPYWVPYYWEGENKGELILQPAKDAVIFPEGGGFTSTLNPLVDRENSVDETRAYDIMGNVYLQYSPIKEVVLKTTFSPTYNRSKQGEFYGVNTESQFSSKNPDTGLPYNTATITNIDRFTYTWDTQANYTKTFGDHSLNALALFSVYSSVLEGDAITANDMPFDVDWYNIGSAGFFSNADSYYEKITMLSYVLRLNYGYKGRYLATVSSRWDGSSKFQSHNRWGAFPSMALAWRISEEDFMKKLSWISNLKLRASVGLTGNNANVGPYDTQALAGTKYWYNFGNTPAYGYGPNGITNSALTWEKTREFNIGLDFGLFKNRINGTVDWYHKISRDLLMEQLTPLELGSSTGAMINNVGKVKNTGIEISLNTVNIKTKNFYWSTTFSFAKNKNEILELNGGKEDLVANKWFIGQPIDVIYDYEYAGVCTAEEAKNYAMNDAIKTKFIEGEMKLKDQQQPGEEGYGVIDENDLVVLGHALPNWTGSLTSNMTYKNFDFSFSIYTKQGGMVESPFMAEFTNYKDRGRNKLKMDYYIPAGTPVLNADGSGYTLITEAHYGSYPYPTNTASNNYGGGLGWGTDKQTTYVGNSYVDNSYVRVKNITLGYSFSQKLLSKIGVDYLRLYVNVLNPFTFTSYKGFDPEWADAELSDGTGGPSTRTYQIGINLKF